MAAAVSVFFWRMQPSGLNQSDTCQLGNVKDPVAEFCSPTVKLVIYLKIATLAASVGPCNCMAAAVSVFFWRMQPSGLNQSDTCQLSNVKDPVAEFMQSHSEIGHLLKNRNFGCFVGPCNCMAAAVSVFFWRMQPSGLNQSDHACQLQ